MKKIFLGMLFTSYLVGMSPVTVGSYTGASLGAVVGAAAGTFMVVDKASSNPLFLMKSREDKVYHLVDNGAAFTVAGYTACGASAGALLGTVSSAVVFGTAKALYSLGNGENVIRNGMFVAGSLAAARILFLALAEKNKELEEEE